MKPGRKFYQKTKEQILSICVHLEIMARNHKKLNKSAYFGLR